MTRSLAKRWAWAVLWVVGVATCWTLLYVPSTTGLRDQPSGTYTGGPVPAWWPPSTNAVIAVSGRAPSIPSWWPLPVFPTWESTMAGLLAIVAAFGVTFIATRWLRAPAVIWVGILAAQLAITYWVHVIAVTMSMSSPQLTINVGDYLAGMWAPILLNIVRESLGPLILALVGAVAGSYLGAWSRRAHVARLASASSGHEQVGQ